MAASPPTEMALSLSSVGMGVLVVMTATGAVAALPPAGMALSLSSVGMGVLFLDLTLFFSLFVYLTT